MQMLPRFRYCSLLNKSTRVRLRRKERYHEKLKLGTKMFLFLFPAYKRIVLYIKPIGQQSIFLCVVYSNTGRSNNIFFRELQAIINNEHFISEQINTCMLCRN